MFGDLVPHITANALCVDLNIINEKLTDFEYIPIVPRDGADGSVASLTLHRQGEHYNGVGTVPITTVTVPMGASEMPDLSESSDKSVHTAYAVNDTVVKYNRKQLLQIGMNNTTHLNRTVRKILFRHSIWRPNRRVTSVNSTMDCAPNCFEGTDHQIQSSLNDERPSQTLISIPR